MFLFDLNQLYLHSPGQWGTHNLNEELRGVIEIDNIPELKRKFICIAVLLFFFLALFKYKKIVENVHKIALEN